MLLTRELSGNPVLFQTYPCPVLFLWINSLYSKIFYNNPKCTIFTCVSLIDILNRACVIAFSWLPRILINTVPSLVHMTAWGRQTRSPLLMQCWPRSLSPWGIITVKTLILASPEEAINFTWLLGTGQRQLQDKARTIQDFGFGATHARGLMVMYCTHHNASRFT